jgi:hypothetical protein
MSRYPGRPPTAQEESELHRFISGIAGLLPQIGTFMAFLGQVNADAVEDAADGVTSEGAPEDRVQEMIDALDRFRSSSAAPPIPPIARQRQQGHIEGTPQHRLRMRQQDTTSTFLNPEEVDDLVVYAWQHGAPTGSQGNLRIYDFRRPIGVGSSGGGYQTQVRVSMDTRGRIHGTPYGPIYHGPLTRPRSE